MLLETLFLYQQTTRIDKLGLTGDYTTEGLKVSIIVVLGILS